MKKRVKRNELFKTYGVLGLTRGAGATSFALTLANYITSVRKKSVCVIELLNEGDKECLEESIEGRNQCMGSVCGKNAKDIFVITSTDPEIVSRLKGLGFGVYIILFHSSSNNTNLFLTMCQKKYVVGSFKPWKRREFGMNFNKLLSNKTDIKALDFLSFGITDDEKKEFLDVYKCQIRELPLINDPLSLKYSQLPEIEKLLD